MTRTTKPDDPSARVESARAAIGDLCARKSEIESTLATIKKEKAALARKALTGDAAARTRLDELNVAAREAGLQLEDFGSAIADAQRDLAAAISAQAADDDRRRREKLRRMAKEFRATGADMDRSLLAFIAAWQKADELADAIRLLDAKGPGSELMRVNVERAVQAALMPAKLNSRMIAPNERRELAKLLDGWARRIESLAADELSDPGAAA